MSTLRFSRKQLCVPYALFLICFVVAPLIVIIYYAFTNGEGQFSLENLTGFFTSPNTIGTLAYSFAIACVSTAAALLLAYPIAYILARSEWKKKSIIVMIFVLPMWINFTLRLTALKEVLTLIEHNLAYYPFLNSVIGMVYDFLPFMILPIYNVLAKIDRDVLYAARDLGANNMQTFFKIILPLSVPGVISGITMVFVPSLTTFVISDLLGGSKILLIGNVIEQEFKQGSNWHTGSGLSLVLMIFIIASMALIAKYDKNGEGTAF